MVLNCKEEAGSGRSRPKILPDTTVQKLQKAPTPKEEVPAQAPSQTAPIPLHFDGTASALPWREDAPPTRPHSPRTLGERARTRGATATTGGGSFQFCSCLDPEIPPLGIYPEEVTSDGLQDFTVGMFIQALLMVTKMRKSLRSQRGAELN